MKLAQLTLACLWLALSPVSSHAEDAERLLLATTTSVRDSGLLDTLLPAFEARTGVQVQVVAVGTGAALRMGSEGNADALLTHAPEAEKKVVTSGAATSRRPFMENHFVLVGPKEDPAKVAEADSPEEALQRIQAGGFAYVSRGDDSGTHKREVALLTAAGLDPAGGWDGFARTGSGMGLTLQVAGERRAYTLSDLGTFLAFRERVDLVALAKPTDALRNVYSVLKIDPERFAKVNARAAQQLEDYLLEPATQKQIAEFGRERFGRSLFRPLALETASP
jgi:tungstate transport system substrate-binding protein